MNKGYDNMSKMSVRNSVNDSTTLDDIVEIVGIPINRISSEDVTNTLVKWALGQQPHHVVTVNPEFVMIGQENKEFLQVLKSASLRIADGIGILWASYLLGKPITERVTGVDTVRSFTKEASKHGVRFFFLGAAPGIAELAADSLRKEYPGLQIVGTYAGTPKVEDEEEICERIKSVHPQVLFVAYGAPIQDLWIARTAHKLKIPVAIGVGGTFDFLAGTAIRAPRWMRRSGLEWLFRLIQEPRRWRRMLRLPRFVIAVFGSIWNRKNLLKGNRIHG
jgi:N-acetylglucosaminyldiphosphoundecaprenol N-acetyl-beta-D-mannosaminyltransferase